MNQKEIDALEPKYTGNVRDLTEGEAAAIANDPANHKDETADSDNLQTAAAFGIFRRT